MLVGSITISSGHIEAGIRRLLVAFARETWSSAANLQWFALHDGLRKAAVDRPSPESETMIALLDWAEQRRLTEHRHNVVHGDWWPVRHGSWTRIARTKRSGETYFIIGRLTEYEAIARDFHEYARRIDILLGDRWPRIKLID